ncbi:unnamed protein product, partial [Sphacelaria rigidula]
LPVHDSCVTVVIHHTSKIVLFFLYTRFNPTPLYKYPCACSIFYATLFHHKTTSGFSVSLLSLPDKFRGLRTIFYRYSLLLRDPRKLSYPTQCTLTLQKLKFILGAVNNQLRSVLSTLAAPVTTPSTFPS